MKRKNTNIKQQRLSEGFTYHMMLLPATVLLIIFSIVPMFGIVMAFQNFIPAKGILGSKWVGWQNFKLLFAIPDVGEVFTNTVIIASAKIILSIVIPVIFALLLNAVRSNTFKVAVQTITYLPYFLSWVLLGGIFINMFSLDGIVNQILIWLGKDPVMFFASNTWFRPLLVITDTWKNYGYCAIVYLAALTSIDQELYEAAAIDGAGRWKQLIYITLPALVPTIILMTTLGLGNVLSAGFDQVYNLYNPAVYETGDIIDTYVFRMGLEGMQYSFSTAVGLLKSVVNFILISLSYFLAKKFAGYSIF